MLPALMRGLKWCAELKRQWRRRSISPIRLIYPGIPGDKSLLLALTRSCRNKGQWFDIDAAAARPQWLRRCGDAGERIGSAVRRPHYGEMRIPGQGHRSRA